MTAPAKAGAAQTVKKHLIFRNLTAEDVGAIIDRPKIPNIYHA